VQHGMAVALVVGGALALSACGSTKTVTETNTVVKESTTTVTASASATTPTTTTLASVTPGNAPALNGTYALNQTAYVFNLALPNNPHDGIGGTTADKQWTFTNGSCSAGQCQVDLRRTMSDSTIEDLMLFSNSPDGVYTGTIPGGDGDATCGGGGGARVKLSMIVRVGGLQNVNGETIASRLAGHIFADYTCPGESPTHDVATYAGTHS
jgi:hypothetical protein